MQEGNLGEIFPSFPRFQAKCNCRLRMFKVKLVECDRIMRYNVIIKY